MHTGQWADQAMSMWSRWRVTTRGSTSEHAFHHVCGIEPRSVTHKFFYNAAMTSPGLSDTLRGRAFLYRLALLLGGPQRCLEHLDRVTSDLVEQAFGDAVAAAAYWQPLDFQELEAQNPVHDQLLRQLEPALEERIANNHTTEPTSTRHPDEPSMWVYLDASWRPEEHWVLWADSPSSCPPFTSVRRHKWLAAMDAHERRAARLDSPTSGEWWSTPPTSIDEGRGGPLRTLRPPVSTTRDIALKWWEDALFVEECAVRRVLSPNTNGPRNNDDLRLYVIDDVQKWVAFVESYPLDVTHQKKGDWEVCTSRSGRWVMPNYAAAAEEWDAVTLTPRAYLLLSGTPQRVELPDGSAWCLLAGWSPGETHWLSSELQLSDPPVRWRLAEDGRIIDAQL